MNETDRSVVPYLLRLGLLRDQCDQSILSLLKFCPSLT
jgi:hypothetical protein